MEDFPRIKRLPPYILAVVTDLKAKMRKAGEDIIDLGMGNPDLPTPKHIVDKLVEASRNPRNHRYSASRGIPKLRLAICNWYKRKYQVELDPETEAIATIRAQEGLSHLLLAQPDDGGGGSGVLAAHHRVREGDRAPRRPRPRVRRPRVRRVQGPFHPADPRGQGRGGGTVLDVQGVLDARMAG